MLLANIKSSHKFLHFQQDSTSRNFGQRHDGPLNLWGNLNGNALLLTLLAKSGKFQTFISTEMRNFG